MYHTDRDPNRTFIYLFYNIINENLLFEEMKLNTKQRLLFAVYG